MAKTIGIGGVFLQFNGDDQEIRDWYESALNMNMTDYGSGFIEGEQLAVVSFTHSGNPTVPTVNFRVDNLEEILQQIVDQGGSISVPTQEYDYGKFAQFKDPFGNYVELWEAYPNTYKKMVQEELNSYKKSNHKS